jgi:hypothetical protein
MFNWKRIAIGLEVVVSVVVIYAWFFGAQTIDSLAVRSEYRRLPELAETPIALSDLSISSTPHAAISCGGYEVELPWDDVDEQKSKRGSAICVTAFRSGNAFVFSSFPARDFVDEVARESRLDPSAVQRAIVGETSRSDYGFVRVMLQTTPADVKPFISKQRAARGMWLLLFKGMAMPSAKSGIFSIRTQDFQGFQYENPQSQPFRITDELFGDDSGIDLMFIRKVGGTAPAITQPEINRILQSIRKAPAGPVASNANLQR